MIKDDNFYKNILENIYDGVCFVDRDKRFFTGIGAPKELQASKVPKL
jgi:hypothetical protein